MSVSGNSAPATSAVDYDPFAGQEIGRVVKTTEPQREVWLAAQLGVEATLAYNESIVIRLAGALNRAALQGAIDELVARHEALRSTFSANGEEMLVGAPAPVPLDIIDVSTATLDQADARLAEVQRLAVDTPFDLATGPLFRATLVAIGPQDHALVIAAHHIICDGWSFGVMVKELGSLYTAFLTGAASPLAPADTWSDYATQMLVRQGGPEHYADERFWLANFADSIPTLDLPTDRPRQAVRTFTSRRADHMLPPDLVAKLRKAGGARGASLFATLLAGFSTLLNRVSGASDVVVGVPAAGQSARNLNSLIGHCVNLLPVRVKPEPTAAFADFLGTARTAMLDAFEHQEYTFGSLLAKLPIARDPSRLPLVSVMFNLDQANEDTADAFSGLRYQFASNARTFENFELFVNAVPVAGGLRLETQYNSDLFDHETVSRWLRCYETLLAGVTADLKSEIGRLPMLAAGDLAVLEKLQAPPTPFESTVRVSDVISRQAAATPNARAVTCNGRTLTYAELESRSNAVAVSLRARGVGAADLVGICVDRSVDMVATMIGVWKAGATYVPLDPAYPRQRLGFMTEDAKLALLVTQSSHAELFDLDASKLLLLDRDGEQVFSAANLASAKFAVPGADAETAAYVIYTSGSTGKPKGVRVPHRSVVNFLDSVKVEPGLTTQDRLVGVTTLSFDIAVLEIFLPLVVGAEVVLATTAQAGDGPTLKELLETTGATVMQATPSTWRILLDAGFRAGKNFKALCGGEPLPRDLADRILGAVGELWNMYGPTETTVWSTCMNIARDRAPISIGRPLKNTTVWILDERGQRCPLGVPGEIFIGGAGVTLGYLERPQLTAERFVRDPYSNAPGALLYRTGDRGRWNNSGTLEHLGRLDFQVKIRGFRIELGEVESAVASHPQISQALAVAWERAKGDIRLVAYIVPKDPSASLADKALRTHLSGSLPEYMIPQHFVVLPAFPLLPNGKIDRSKLPLPVAKGAAKAAVAPRNELERIVADAMAATLSLPEVSVEDDFFELGGHSLLAAQLTTRLGRDLSIRLPLRSLFEAPTVAKLAETVASIRAKETGAPTRAPLVRRADQSHAPLTVMQQRIWFIEELHPGRITYNTPSAHRLRGPLKLDVFQKAFDAMVQRQSVLRTSFATVEAQPRQIVQDRVDTNIGAVEDLSTVPEGEREEALMRRLDELIDKPFDLTSAPLFRTRMLKVGADDHVFFFMPHHLIWDGWSFDVMYQDLSAFYEAFLNDTEAQLPATTVSYGDHAAWQRDWVKSPDFQTQLDYWNQRMRGDIRPQALPTDFHRPPGMSGKGATEWISLDRQTTDRLHDLSKKVGSTLFITLLSAYYVLLHRSTSLTELVVGTPVRGRSTAETEPLMGFFTNLLPLPVRVDPAESFIDLARRVKSVVLDGFTYPDVPFEMMSQGKRSAGDDSRSVLYQALFSFQDVRARPTRWGNLEHTNIPVFQRGATEDLGLWFLENRAGLKGGITYNSDVFTAETACAYRDRYLALLNILLADASRAVGELNEVTPIVLKTLDPQAPGAAPAAGIRAPATPTEKALAQVWQRLLSVPSVSVDDNFFDLGGNSLQVMQVLDEMATTLGKRVGARRFVFENLGQLAMAYDEAATEKAEKAKSTGFFGKLFGSKSR